MSRKKENHVRCPYENDCNSHQGYCHRWMEESTAFIDGKMTVVKVIHDCQKNLIKV